MTGTLRPTGRMAELVPEALHELYAKEHAVRASFDAARLVCDDEIRTTEDVTRLALTAAVRSLTDELMRERGRRARAELQLQDCGTMAVGGGGRGAAGFPSGGTSATVESSGGIGGCGGGATPDDLPAQSTRAGATDAAARAHAAVCDPNPWAMPKVFHRCCRSCGAPFLEGPQVRLTIDAMAQSYAEGPAGSPRTIDSLTVSPPFAIAMHCHHCGASTRVPPHVVYIENAELAQRGGGHR